MIARLAVYVGIAGMIVAGAVWLNRTPERRWVRYHVDPEAAMSAPSHNHAITQTACECNPEQEMRQALADRAGYSMAHLEQGDKFYARGRYDEAQHCYERAVEQDPNNAAAHYGLGLVWMKRAKFDRAAECFAHAVEVNRRFINGYVALGMAHYCRGDFARARVHWETALQFEPKHSYASALAASLPETR